MQRREFVTALGSAAAWPLIARAQQPDRMRRIGVLMGSSEIDAGAFFAAFVEELARLGWTDGRNVRIEQRWANADVTRASVFASELVATQPDVILVSTTPATAALHRENSTIPIVFTLVSDPVGAGFVAGLPRPGGKMTGFTQTDTGLGGKWLALLREIAPGIKRAAAMFNPDAASGRLFLGSFETAARLMSLEPVRMPVASDADIEAATATLGGTQAGLELMDDSFMAVHRREIILATARNNLPAIGAHVQWARDGLLIGYGADLTDQFLRAADYVDRILRSAKPADLPVQTPTKYDLAINLKAAKALGIEVSPTLLARADEVIE
jgi:putative ABC transport system substrate-binding protein